MNDQHPDLFGLLRGELSNAEASAVGEHLDTCAACLRELADVAVGHALLTGTTRTLRASSPTVLPEVPGLGAAADPGSRRWPRRLALVAVAAAAALVVGSVAVTRTSDRPDTPPVAAPEQTADLEPVEGTGGGKVLMASGRDEVTMTIETHDLPPIRSGQVYYVWLFNPATEKMFPLGVIGPGGQASFHVPDSLVGRYQVVDVSLERDDGDPAHSVTSVLRASYGSADPGTARS
jgi:hypothetical protein